MGCSLMQLPDFRESIFRSDAALKDTGLVVSRMLMDADDATFEDTVHAFVGLAAIQVNFSYWNSDMFLSFSSEQSAVKEFLISEVEQLVVGPSQFHQPNLVVKRITDSHCNVWWNTNKKTFHCKTHLENR